MDSNHDSGADDADIPHEQQDLDGDCFDDDAWDVLAEVATGWIPSLHSILPDHRSDGTGDAVAALTELFEVVVDVGAACVIISPADLQGVFVQTIATPVGYRLESVSNVFLWDTEHRLTEQQHALLRSLGWVEHDVPADPADRPDDWRGNRELAVNWWRDLEGAMAAPEAASLLLRTLVLVYSLESESPFEIEIFPATHQDWVWDDGLRHTE